MADWEDITQAITTALNGDTVRGRELLLACWEQTSDEQPAQRCVLAHYLADLEDDVDDEVRWDEQALASYADVGDDDLVDIGIPAAAGLEPSLRLNLGDGYLRQGRIDDARAECAAGQAIVDVLRDDGYGALIRDGLNALQSRIDAA